MTRDLLGNRIKQPASGLSHNFMERFYIHDDKIYQIVRFKRNAKMGENGFVYTYSMVVVNHYKEADRMFRQAKTKTKSVVLSQKEFEGKKFYFTLSKVLRAL